MAWITGNRYLSQSEMENNAKEVYNYFIKAGWTINAISAMLGNMESESNINPGIWEGLTVDTSRGYGLVQWTPSTKYTDWAGEGYENGNKQCERIQYEVDNGLQWFENPKAPIVDPPITFKEFSTSTLDVATLANYFLWYYEHPAVTDQPIRATQAQEWLTFLRGVHPVDPPVDPPIVPPNPTKHKLKMPIWMMCRPY